MKLWLRKADSVKLTLSTRVSLAYANWHDIDNACSLGLLQVIRVRDGLSEEFARLCYNGFW